MFRKSKKLIAMALAVAMMMGMSTSVFAVEGTVSEMPTITQNEDITPYTFVREYAKSIKKSGYTEVLYDSNDQSDTKVIIELDSLSVSGTVTFRLTEIGGTEQSFSLSGEGKRTFYVGAGNAFRVAATGIDGIIVGRVRLEE